MRAIGGLIVAFLDESRLASWLGGNHEVSTHSKWKSRSINAAVLLASFVVTISLAEVLLRSRYVEPKGIPSVEVQAIQRHLILNPDIGFTWRTNVDPEEDVVFQYKDAAHIPLSTDQWGFINAPEAIAAQTVRGAVDIIGLGDSFMEHAAHAMHASFDERSLLYYSMAIHRQSTPHYNEILTSFALDQAPKVVLYGIYENDFAEATDFDEWQSSSLDWFAFHSGTWCGRPLESSPVIRFVTDTFAGSTGLLRVVRARLGQEGSVIVGPTTQEIRRVASDVITAHAIATEANAYFLLLLIPSRITVLEGDTTESKAYDRVLEEIDMKDIPVIDFRDPFRAAPDPASLYYQFDGHWNADGIDLATRVIVEHLDTAPISLSRKNDAQ